MKETKPKITLLHHTPLWVCAVAIRTCYDMVDKSDNGGEKDKALIYKVGNKNKHSSTLEHLLVVVDTTCKEIAQVFKENSYSKVTEEGGGYRISCNVRALQEINLPKEQCQQMIPEEYYYLFEEFWGETC